MSGDPPEGGAEATSKACTPVSGWQVSGAGLHNDGADGRTHCS